MRSRSARRLVAVLILLAVASTRAAAPDAADTADRADDDNVPPAAAAAAAGSKRPAAATPAARASQPQREARREDSAKVAGAAGSSGATTADSTKVAGAAGSSAERATLTPWPVVGIDFGNLFSQVAVKTTRGIELVLTEAGTSTVPSYVFVDPVSGERLVGYAARRRSHQAPGNTIFGIKRLLGKSMNTTEVRNDLRKVQYTAVDVNLTAHFRVTVDGKEELIPPEELAGAVLDSLRLTAQAALHRPVSHAVVAVPAHFGDDQLAALEAAASRAGLTVLRFVDEPTASLAAYDLDTSKDAPLLVVVLSAGLASTDLSLLRVRGDGQPLETLGTRRLPDFGGEDIDYRLVWQMVDRFFLKHGIDASQDAGAFRRLHDAVHAAKAQFATRPEAVIEIDDFLGGHKFYETLRRSEYEQTTRDFIARLSTELDQLLASQHLDRVQINEVVLVGGLSHDQKVYDIFKTYFLNKEPKRSISPDEAIAYGCAVIAARLSTPPEGGLTYDFFTPPLGYEAVNGSMKTFLPQFAPCPRRLTDTFVFPENGFNDRVFIRLYEGDQPLAADNRLVGFVDLRVEPIGIGNTVEVVFECGEDGEVTVTATERPGYSQTVTLPANRSALNSTEIAEQYAASVAELEASKEVTAAKRRLQVYASQVPNLATKPLSIRQRDELHRAVFETHDWLAQQAKFNIKDYEDRQDLLNRTVEAIFNNTLLDGTRIPHDEL